jgi:hypothetical protein
LYGASAKTVSDLLEKHILIRGRERQWPGKADMQRERCAEIAHQKIMQLDFVQVGLDII